jgi:hypothetical protein
MAASNTPQWLQKVEKKRKLRDDAIASFFDNRSFPAQACGFTTSLPVTL